jgi:hypothetical protein
MARSVEGLLEGNVKQNITPYKHRSRRELDPELVARMRALALKESEADPTAIEDAEMHIEMMRRAQWGDDDDDY